MRFLSLGERERERGREGERESEVLGFEGERKKERERREKGRESGDMRFYFLFSRKENDFYYFFREGM
jgi:hypothetical protein